MHPKSVCTLGDHATALLGTVGASTHTPYLNNPKTLQPVRPLIPAQACTGVGDEWLLGFYSFAIIYVEGCHGIVL